MTFFSGMFDLWKFSVWTGALACDEISQPCFTTIKSMHKFGWLLSGSSHEKRALSAFHFIFHIKA
jgi:hypothetical protein